MNGWDSSPADVFEESAEEEIKERVQKIGRYVIRDLVAMSPVDTGQFVSNWMVKIGSPDRRVMHVGFDTSGIVSLLRAESVIEDYLPYDSLHISSNVHYAVELNNGKSSQAPANFVQLAVIAALNKV